MITLRCPKCGKEIKANDDAKQIFCDECGAMVAVPEKEEKKTASCSDDAETAEKITVTSMAEALLAYDKGEYEAAYEYYNSVGTDSRDSWSAKLLAGLSSSAMSKPLDLKLRDGITAAKNAAASGYFGDDKYDTVASLVSRVRALVKNFTETNYVHGSDYIYPDAYYAKDHFEGTSRFVEYYEACSDLMNAETLRRWPALEEVKKELVNEALEYIKEAGKSVEYLIGYKNVVKGKGQIVTQSVEEKMSCPFASQYKATAEKLKYGYNSVPSTTDRLKKFDEEIAANKSVVEDYKKSLDEYLSKNPEDAKVYKTWRLFSTKKKLEDVESRFPQDLIDKKNASAASEKAVENLIAEKKKFEKENLL